jgi:hypothetical protein
MPRRVYLHIGLPKTGTTAVQEMLWHNRDALAAAGVCYPSYIYAAHYLAAIDLQPERYRDWLEPLSYGAWDRLVEHVRSWPGTAVISCELLATATRQQVRRALASLDFAEVHLICTARDLARQIPSVWQENIKTGQATPFPDLVTALRTGEPTETSGLFWDYQDLTGILGTWAADLPPERVHVVTVPRNGSGVWPRFASVLDLDVPGLGRSGRDNSSLGAAEVELLRRLNLTLDVAWPHYAAVVRDQLAAELLARRPVPRRIVLPVEDQPWVAKQAQQFVDEIREAGYHVVGDLTELLPADDDFAATYPEPSAGELLDVAIDALAQLVPRVAREWPRKPVSVKQTLLDLSERHPPAMALRRLYWTGKTRISWIRNQSARRVHPGRGRPLP